MSRRSRRRLRSRLVTLALGLTLVAVAVPLAGSAAAKGQDRVDPCAPPARNVVPRLIQPPVECDRDVAQAQGTGDEGGVDAGVVAAGAALLALAAAGGLLFATRRALPPYRRGQAWHT
jgi:hypothetical protein